MRTQSEGEIRMGSQPEVVILKGESNVLKMPMYAEKSENLYQFIHNYFLKKKFQVYLLDAGRMGSAEQKFLFEHLSAKTAYIVGHSFGTQVLVNHLKTIQNQCDNLRSIILLDPMKSVEDLDFDPLPVFTFWSSKWKDRIRPSDTKLGLHKNFQDDHFFNNSLGDMGSMFNIITN
jgi:hypothetical protein